ncbi:RmlC-like cupin [Gloeophyllum trabeum ATCC 11539]|uniref:RmlC-like cupin n=1 Tax=Gloeophyllum trabeum (strain ATCC 11539 / FP-39264 / Madison 617) TaxID=670483 RepID=S7RE62_GLOTA|nr:RmlC-like cupin [Gloeophyllum trabeum ATCC 11539]EPQ50759.1 RmlC-like cupin [Gloeophyllum trabeum ATCC 11539]
MGSSESKVNTTGRTVEQTKASEVKTGTGQTEGMIRQAAIVGKSDRICGTLMRAQPHSSSAVHHHAEQDTIVYGVSGRGTIAFGPNGQNRVEMNPGDWAIIPAYAEHQEINDGDEEVVWAIVRSGGTPAVVNLKGWGQPPREDQ